MYIFSNRCEGMVVTYESLKVMKRFPVNILSLYRRIADMLGSRHGPMSPASLFANSQCDGA